MAVALNIGGVCNLREAFIVACDAASRKRRKTAPVVIAIDDEDDDEGAYQLKMSRWVAGALSAMLSEEFWLRLHIANTSRQPVDHAMRWFMKVQTGKGNFDGKPVAVEWVCEKASTIMLHFESLMSADRMRIQWPLLLDIVDESYRASMMAEAVFHCVSVAADFFRRAVLKTRIYPDILLWLVWSPPHRGCGERIRCASELLESFAAGSVYDVTTRKIVVLFEKQLKIAARDGILDLGLANLLDDIAIMWALDTQEIEGANNTVKYCCKSAPFIHWQLLNARVCNRTPGT